MTVSSQLSAADATRLRVGGPLTVEELPLLNAYGQGSPA